MTEVPPGYSERVKLISELLCAFKRLLPELTVKHEIRKVESDIRYHKKMLKVAKDGVKNSGVIF